MQQRKIVYICSPFRRNYAQNTIRANIFSRYAYEKGCLPITPHVIFPQFLDDKVKSERQVGMEMGLQLLTFCDELWAFGAVISDGMKIEIDLAKNLKKPVRYIDEDLDE